ncbi:MAG: Crp/Fnr family transcriptional regulator [Anaerolineales bacterium]|nr:Crp/Fnr family transcriptional regulator [Anaerolineales bacterium]
MNWPKKMLWLLSKPILESILEDYPPVARAIIQNLAIRLNSLAGMLGNLALQPVETRLAQYLLAEENDGVFLRKKMGYQAELAAHLGTVPDVLNRALRSLSENALVEVNRKEIRILD